MILAVDAVPPLPAHHLLLLLLQVGLLLLIALCLGRLAERVGLPSVVGELMTGVILGPSLLGWAAPGLAGWLLPTDPSQAHLLDAVSQLGLLLLVGIAGAHLDLKVIGRRGQTIAWLGLTTLSIPLVLGLTVGYLLPGSMLMDGVDRVTIALFLGVAMSVTAIPVIAKTLADMKLLHRDVGQITLAVATVDDAVAWLLLSVVSTMAVSGLLWGQVALSVLYLVGFVAFAATLGRRLVRGAMRLAARSAEPGVSSTTATILIILFAAASHALGLEAVFGAFLAGVLIGAPGAGDPVRLAPLRTVVLAVLAPIFLASAGLRIDLTALVEPVVLLTGLVILAVAVLGKVAGAYLGARISRLGHWEGLALGAGLNARGAVEIVVAMVGLRLGLLNTAMYTIIVLVGLCTSVMAPPMLRWTMRRVELKATERLREAELAGWTGVSATRQREEPE